MCHLPVDMVAAHYELLAGVASLWRIGLCAHSDRCIAPGLGQDERPNRHQMGSKNGEACKVHTHLHENKM